MEDQGKRILLFVVAAAGIFFVWQWLFPPEKADLAKSTPVVQHAPSALGSPVGQALGVAEEPASGSPVGAPPPAASPGAGTSLTPPEEKTLVLAFPELRVTFSNVGGVVREWMILSDPIKGRVMNEKLFVSDRPERGLGATNFLRSTLVLPPNASWSGEQLSDRKVRYRTSAGGIEVVKEYEVFPRDYVVKMTIDVALAGDLTGATQQLAVSLFGHAAHSREGRAKVPTGAICHLNGKVSTVGASDLQKGPRERRGTVRWAGLAHQYDLIAVAPRPGDEDLACNAYPLEGVKDGIQVDLVFPAAKLKAGDPPLRREVIWYVGPKYLDRLEGADAIAGFAAGFTDVVDYGWFGFISRPMLWLLHRLYDVVQNWGVAIILLTISVKLATLYWTTKSMRSMKAMAALRPQMEEIQKRYPDDRAQQQQAQMALFKQHGVSPLSGCLPMLLQMPIWLALYNMLSVAGELHQAVFIPGWLVDLTARDPYFILPVTLTAAMFLQSKVQPPAGDSMQQKILMYGLPLMFGVMGLYFPSGLGVYMLTNTLLGIGHSLYMKHTDPKSPAVLATAKSPAATAGVAERARRNSVGSTAPDPTDVALAESDDADSEPPARAANIDKGQRGKRRGKRR